MRIEGTATLHAPAARVWAALTDPAVLARTIPGCEQLEAIGVDSGSQRYRLTVTAGVASIKGTYLGEVELADPEPPTSFTLRASGSGAPGTVSANVVVTLEDAGGGSTGLRYAADAVVGGPVGGVGQRLLVGVAKRTAGQFFAAVDDELNGTAPVAGPAAPPEPATVVARPGAGAVFAGRPVPLPPAASREKLVAALVGAAIALAGVWLGARLPEARSRR
jgi:carbon monoxide dehydrogenase subunit G